MIKNEGIVTLPEMRLAGSAIRTTNRAEDNPVTARIPGHWAEFRASISQGNIPGAVNNSPVAVYTHYESDHTGEYTHFIGFLEVNEFPDNQLDRCLIPAGPYLKFSGEERDAGGHYRHLARGVGLLREPRAAYSRLRNRFRTLCGRRRRGLCLGRLTLM